MGLDGALRAQGRPVRRHPQRARHDGLGSGDGPGPGRAVLARPTVAGKAACRADLLTRLGFDPDDDGAGHRDDRAARPAEGLRPAGRRAAPALLDARRAARRPGQRPSGARGPVPGDSPTARPEQVALIERFDRVMARRIYAGLGLLRDAVAVRAVRPGPDDRAALRDAADRPPDRRAGRHGHRRDDAPGRPAPGSSSRRRRSRRCSRRATRRCACGRPAARRGTALLDRGMAVDFDWVTGSAPRYVEAYERAAEIRRRRG